MPSAPRPVGASYGERRWCIRNVRGRPSLHDRVHRRLLRMRPAGWCVAPSEARSEPWDRDGGPGLSARRRVGEWERHDLLQREHWRHRDHQGRKFDVISGGQRSLDGHANSVNVGINFTSRASPIFLVHNLRCDKCIELTY